MSESSASSFPLATPEGLPRSHYTYFIVPFGYRVQEPGGQNALEYREDPDYATHLPVLDGPIGPAEPGPGRKRPPNGRSPTQDEVKRYRRARLSYLLPETHLTLFGRAKWLRLGKSGRAVELDGQLTNGRGRVSRFGAEAVLVLFEWPGAVDLQPEEDNILRVGFLLLATVLKDASQLADLLDFNEHARYLEQPNYDGYWSDITLRYNDGPDNHLIVKRDRTDSDSYWSFWRTLIEQPNLWVGETARQLKVTAPFQQSIESTGFGKAHEHFHPSGYPDDRAYTYTYACVDELPDFASFEVALQGEQRDWERVWHTFLDVDLASSLPDELTAYQRRWLADRTYGRWLERGTVYGYTNFSAAALAQSDRAWSLAYHHFHLMYLDQLLLLLYERTALSLCSAALSERSHQSWPDQPEGSSVQFRSLRRQFTWLTNLYQFPMFTAQYQGQEMYTLAREHLNIDGLYKEVATEIAATDQLLAQERDEQLTQSLATIQRVALVLALAAIGLTALQTLVALFQLQQPPADWAWVFWGQALGVFLTIFSLSSLGASAIYLARSLARGQRRAERRERR